MLEVAELDIDTLSFLRRFASDHLGEHAFMLEVVRKNANALEFASKNRLHAGPTKNANPWEYTALTDDREFVLEAVRQNGLLLQYASDNLKKDRELVLEACGGNECALQFASEELQSGDLMLLLTAHFGELLADGTIAVSFTSMSGDEVESLSVGVGSPVSKLLAAVGDKFPGHVLRLNLPDGRVLGSDMASTSISDVVG